MALDAAKGEVILFQNVGLSHSEWALYTSSGKWFGGKLVWPPIVQTELAPYGASRARVNYPIVLLHDRTVHLFGAAAYDNWARIQSLEDLGIRADPNHKGGSGMKGRKRGNRFRRLFYSWNDDIGAHPFNKWIEIDNTFDDGGWLFPGDMHLDTAGTVHLLWYRAPMLRSLRDSLYQDIKLVYTIEYATIRNGAIIRRQTLVRAEDGRDNIFPTDIERENSIFIQSNGEKIFCQHIATPRFHIVPDGRIFVVYFVSGMIDNGAQISENRILQVFADGTISTPVTIPLKHPLSQFFTATPRAGCMPSFTLDLLGHRRGDWHLLEESEGREWRGTLSYACVRLGASD
jgi:hypothetical protein